MILLVSVGPEPANSGCGRQPPPPHCCSHAGQEGWAVAVATVPNYRSSLGPWKPGVPGGRLPSQAFLNGLEPSTEADAQPHSSFCGPWIPPGSGPGDLGGPRAGPLKLLRPAQNRPEIETSSRKALLALQDKVQRSGERGIPATNSQMILERLAAPTANLLSAEDAFPFACPPPRWFRKFPCFQFVR